MPTSSFSSSLGGSGCSLTAGATAAAAAPAAACICGAGRVPVALEGSRVATSGQNSSSARPTRQTVLFYCWKTWTLHDLVSNSSLLTIVTCLNLLPNLGGNSLDLAGSRTGSRDAARFKVCPCAPLG